MLYCFTVALRGGRTHTAKTPLHHLVYGPRLALSLSPSRPRSLLAVVDGNKYGRSTCPPPHTLSFLVCMHLFFLSHFPSPLFRSWLLHGVVAPGVLLKVCVAPTPLYRAPCPHAPPCRLRTELGQLGFKEADLNECEEQCGGLRSMAGSLDWLLLHLPEERIPASLASTGTAAYMRDGASGGNKKAKRQKPKRLDPTKLTDFQKVAYSLSLIGFDYEDCESATQQNRKQRLMTDSLQDLFGWYAYTQPHANVPARFLWLAQQPMPNQRSNVAFVRMCTNAATLPLYACVPRHRFGKHLNMFIVLCAVCGAVCVVPCAMCRVPCVLCAVCCTDTGTVSSGTTAVAPTWTSPWQPSNRASPALQYPTYPPPYATVW